MRNGQSHPTMFHGSYVDRLGSCAFNVEPFLTKEITGSDFLSFLAREYQRRTDFEVKVEREWGACQSFGRERRAGPGR